jgi:hypothetical protein
MSALRLAGRLGALTVTCAALIVPGASLATASIPATAHRGILPPKNPSRSLQPVPAFTNSPKCFLGKDTAACNSLVLRAIAHARKVLEKLPGMSFSLAAYQKLTPVEQLFATADLERVARGQAPATVLTRSLDKVAQIGANKDEDPPLNEVRSTLPGGGFVISLGGNWAGGWDNALGANYGWMYDDGLGSDNGDCTKTHKSGCWGHRDNILRTYSTRSECGGAASELAMGAGHVTKGKAYGDSETELFAGVCGPAPTDVVITWQKVKRLLKVK